MIRFSERGPGESCLLGEVPAYINARKMKTCRNTLIRHKQLLRLFVCVCERAPAEVRFCGASACVMRCVEASRMLVALGSLKLGRLVQFSLTQSGGGWVMVQFPVVALWMVQVSPGPGGGWVPCL